MAMGIISGCRVLADGGLAADAGAVDRPSTPLGAIAMIAVATAAVVVAAVVAAVAAAAVAAAAVAAAAVVPAAALADRVSVLADRVSVSPLIADCRLPVAAGASRYGPAGSAFTTSSAGGCDRRRRVNQPAVGSIVLGDFSRDNCCSMSTYFFSITGHA